MFVLSRRMVTIVGTILIGTAWLLAFVVVGAAGLEALLRIRSSWQNQPVESASPKIDRLAEAYESASADHLDPQYLFFFPRDPHERAALSNQTVSIDADGFRGLGPAHAGGRRLAFLVGASAAFGWYASSDATTITSYLNRMQDQYFFVNAGVGGWNSGQELSRVALQILDYHPALVMTYDGVNDAVFPQDYYERGYTFPTGTPSNFDRLTELVDEARPAGPRRLVVEFATHLFPELAARASARLHKDDAPPRPSELPESSLQDAVGRYLSNLAHMRELTVAEGARFIAIFQPAAQLHQHLGSTHPFEEGEVVSRFHKAVMERYAHDFELHDLGNVFDQHYASVPFIDPDVTDETVFVDEVHLYDPGNEIVARHLAGLLK